jgi:uroporphyrinogen-III synthase
VLTRERSIEQGDSVLERKPLAGRVIAVPECRQLEKLAAMLEEKGATILRCPLVAMRDSADAPSIEAWLGELIGGSFDDFILMSGEGLSRLIGFARRAGMHESATKALGRLRTIARGPKACRALRDLGLLPNLTPETPTTDGIIDALHEHDLAGRTMALQLCGGEPNPRLVRFLEKAGAKVRSVAPYEYTQGADDDRVADLIDRLVKGEIDSIAFTSTPQIDRLFQIGESRDGGNLLRLGLEKTRVAAVGPVAANALRRRGVRVHIVPERSFFLRSLVQEVVAALR